LPIGHTHISTAMTLQEEFFGKEENHTEKVMTVRQKKVGDIIKILYYSAIT
jgi:hypothetical protein